MEANKPPANPPARLLAAKPRTLHAVLQGVSPITRKSFEKGFGKIVPFIGSDHLSQAYKSHTEGRESDAIDFYRFAVQLHSGNIRQNTRGQISAEMKSYVRGRVAQYEMFFGSRTFSPETAQIIRFSPQFEKLISASYTVSDNAAKINMACGMLAYLNSLDPGPFLLRSSIAYAKTSNQLEQSIAEKPPRNEADLTIFKSAIASAKEASGALLEMASILKKELSLS